MPTSSPLFSGMVEWESKKGKWSKRWMQLREHNLYLSKRDRAKEEVFLCSLSNFDAYYVTRPCKAPKPFVFAIKSTDNLALFENSADYLHVFACQAKDGEAWMQRILLARVSTPTRWPRCCALIVAPRSLMFFIKNVIYFLIPRVLTMYLQQVRLVAVLHSPVLGQGKIGPHSRCSTLPLRTYSSLVPCSINERKTFRLDQKSHQLSIQSIDSHIN